MSQATAYKPPGTWPTSTTPRPRAYYAQTYGPGADGRGIIAASRNGLTDCGGGTYYTSLHTGTTAWYILAADKINPFALIPAPDRH